MIGRTDRNIFRSSENGGETDCEVQEKDEVFTGQPDHSVGQHAVPKIHFRKTKVSKRTV